MHRQTWKATAERVYRNSFLFGVITPQHDRLTTDVDIPIVVQLSFIMTLKIPYNTTRVMHKKKSTLGIKLKLDLNVNKQVKQQITKNISSLYLVTYFTKVFCNLRLMGEKQVSTAERETRNSQVHASKNFLGLYSRSAQTKKRGKSTIQDEGITVNVQIINVHTSN